MPVAANQQRPRGRRQGCRFCAHPTQYVIDYKNVALLQQFLDERGRIRKAGKTRSCRRHQSQIAHHIKRAREMALLPSTAG